MSVSDAENFITQMRLDGKYNLDVWWSQLWEKKPYSTSFFSYYILVFVKKFL